MGTVALGSNVCSHKHLHRSTVPFAVFPGLPRRTFLMRTSMLCCNSKSALQHSSSPPSQPWRTSRRPATSMAAPSCLCRSEEHTSELQSLMRISYAVFCLNNTHPYQLLHLSHS